MWKDKLKGAIFCVAYYLSFDDLKVEVNQQYANECFVWCVCCTWVMVSDVSVH